MNTKAFCNTCMVFIDTYEVDEYEDGSVHHNGCEGSSVSFQEYNKEKQS